MKIISKFKIDLQHPGSTPILYAVQNDRYSRTVALSLYDKGRPWPVPAEAAVLIRYRKHDGKGGEYDTLPNGEAAWSANGNTLTIELAPQVLTAPGTVTLSISLTAQERQLSMFPLHLYVSADAQAAAPDQEGCGSVTGFLPAPSEAECGQYFRVASVSSAGKVTGVEAVTLTAGGAEIDTAQIREIVEEYLNEAADPAGTADAAVARHNTNSEAHNDLRVALQALADRVNAALDSDDTTLDELSEIVRYIKSNKTLIDAITTGKVSVTDIADNLTTRLSDKPLSAAQGVVLKELIDTISIPVLSVNGQTGAVALSAADVNADPQGTADSLVSGHNSDSTAHADIRQKLEQLSSGVQSTLSVPVFWQEAVNSAATAVRETQALGGSSCVSFALCSDMHIHWPGETDTNYARNIGSIAAAVMDRCSIPLMVNCGDLLTNTVYSEESDLEKAYAQAWSYLAAVGPERILLTAGNHDGAWGTDVSGDRFYVNNMDPARLWQHLYRPQAADFRRVWGEDGTYFYLDNLPQKTRFLCLNSHDCQWSENEDGTAVCNTMTNGGYTQRQLDFLIAALDVPEGWTIVLFSHVPPTDRLPTDYSSLRCCSLIRGIVSAYANRTTYSGSRTHISSNGERAWADASVSVDFTGAAGTIAGWFCGHCHRDAVITGDLPFPIITMTCAGNFSYDSAEAARTLGTDEETAVDFVTIHKGEKNICMTRLGIGSDRCISYGTMYSITNQLTDVTTSNPAVSVAAGNAYTATLTAVSGTVTGVTVTMGGEDITDAAYSNGVITIGEVTGAIVITAAAESGDPFAFTESNWSCTVPSAMTLSADSITVVRGTSGEIYATCNHRFSRKEGTYSFSVKGNGSIQNNAVLTAVQVFDADGKEITDTDAYVPNHSYTYNSAYGGFMMNTGYGSFTFTLSDAVDSFRMKFGPGTIAAAGKAVTMSEFTLIEP